MMATLNPKAPGLFLMTNSFETGGSERQFTALARSLQGSPFRIKIGCILKGGAFLEGFEDALEFPVGGNSYGPGSMRARLRLARYLRDSNTAIAHSFDFYTNLLLIPAARLARVPVVIGSQRQLGDLLTPAKSLAETVALGWCDRVVCNSSAAAQRLITRGLPERLITIIGNGLDPSFFGSLTPALPRNPALLRVGMVARMNAQSKGHREFLEAAAIVHSNIPGTEFILVGDGPLRHEMEQQAHRLGIGQCTQFLGEQRHVPAVLASLDVTVMPSRSESLSNAILESMAAGVPVIASRVGGNPELISDARGILVDDVSPEGLAAAIERLLRSPEMRNEFARNGRRFVESNFNSAATKKKFEDLYMGLLEASADRRISRLAMSLSSSSQKRPLRVAIVAASSRYVGGQSVQAELLLSNWRADPEVEAFFIPIDTCLPHFLKWSEKTQGLRTLIRQPFYIAALWKALDRADIAHIFSASYWSFLIATAPAWMVARIRGKKALIHYHSGEARDHLRRFRTARPVLARADRVVVPSHYLVDVLGEFGLSAQAVPNLVDSAQFNFRERRPLRPHLLCTRGFHPYYRVDLVVRAFAEIKREFPLARLDLIGQGPQEKEIRSLVSRLNLTDVNFAGIASRKEIGWFYDAADIFINASALDNMPVSVLEAFASGTPVVSTAPEGMQYLVQHEKTGLLSEPGDEIALARNVIRLLQDPDLGFRLARQAYHQSQQYHWSRVREQWLEIYRFIAGQASRASQTGKNTAVSPNQLTMS